MWICQLHYIWSIYRVDQTKCVQLFNGAHVYVIIHIMYFEKQKLIYFSIILSFYFILVYPVGSNRLVVYVIPAKMITKFQYCTHKGRKIDRICSNCSKIFAQNLHHPNEKHSRRNDDDRINFSLLFSLQLLRKKFPIILYPVLTAQVFSPGQTTVYAGDGI